MALGTVTVVEQGVMGDLKYAVLDVNVTSGANYAQGGEAIPLANFGFNVACYFGSVVPDGVTSGTEERFVFIPTTRKLAVALDDGTTGVPAEAATNADLSAVNVRIFALGR